jgi:hypothetical protein
MHARFDQVDKTILGRALSLLGDVRREHEVAADAQRADTSFQPAPGCEPQRARLGLLARMTVEPCLFEVFHGAFGLTRFDDCVRKQLTFGHLEALKARKAGQQRPPKPRLWIFSGGRPSSVLQGYALAPMRGFPPGFHGGPAAAAFGVVVTSELPRERSTLFFRLFGKGEVRALALQDLAALPPDAWEREAALEPLVALRIQIPEDDPREEERRFLMATQDLYEQWKQRMVQEGIQQGTQRTAAQALISVYEARFGPVPAELRAAIERAAAEEDALPRWAALFSTRPEQEIAKALLAIGPARRRPSARRGGAEPHRR